MNDFVGDKVVDTLVENGPSMKDRGINEAGGGSNKKIEVYDEHNPPPLEDKAALARHKQALVDNTRENNARFEHGLEAARKSIENVPGATMDVEMKWNAAAGKEVPVVNTYTPKPEDLPQIPQDAKTEK